MAETVAMGTETDICSFQLTILFPFLCVFLLLWRSGSKQLNYLPQLSASSMTVCLHSNGLETCQGCFLGFHPADRLQPAMIRLNTVHYREWICSSSNIGIQCWWSNILNEGVKAKYEHIIRIWRHANSIFSVINFFSPLSPDWHSWP